MPRRQPNKQRADGAFQWRTRVLRTGREIIEIERRARTSAEKQGKGQDLEGVEESEVARAVLPPLNLAPICAEASADKGCSALRHSRS